MPIYEYQCQSCHQRISVLFRTFSDVTDPSCTQCGSGDLTRLISSFTVIKSWGESLNNLPAFDHMDDYGEDMGGMGGMEGMGDFGGWDD